MVDDRPLILDEIFGALGHATRRTILARLRGGTATVGELSDLFPVSLNAVSKHVKVLERAGLVERRVRGREHHLALNRRALLDAGAWIAHHARFWNDRLDALEAMLEDEAEA